MNSSPVSRRFRPVLALSSAFALVSLAMEAALVVQSVSGTPVDGSVWTRCSLVLASAITVLLLAVAAARGSRPAWRRVRIISPIVVLAVIVVVSIPGFLPGWVRLEQGVCGALVLPAAIILNLRSTAVLFPKPTTPDRAAEAARPGA